MHCSRVAKINRESSRPRTIVVQLSSPRIRDQFIASAVKYNKANPNGKLNSALLGIGNTNVPIFVTEHLSTANKTLHAAARLKAKEKGYKFVWIRNGRIFMRKSEDSDYILVKNMDTISKLA